MRKKEILNLSIFVILLLSGCAPRTLHTAPTSQTQLWQKVTPQSRAQVGDITFGQASWYGEQYNGRTTAYGEQYDMNANTAAHKSLPYNTLVKVTNMMTGKSEIVRINDKGPFKSGRIIDLSKGTAERLGFLDRGTTNVRLEVVGGQDSARNSIPTRQKIATNLSTQNLPQGIGCVGDHCKAKITKAPQDVYSQPSNAFNAPLLESVERGAEPKSIDQKVKEEEARFMTMKQNSIMVDSGIAPCESNFVDEVEMLETPFMEPMMKPSGIVSSSQIVVQVGAFSILAGAKEYAKRYNLLDAQHQAKINEEMVNAQTLYKVQIEGFSNDTEARQFIERHHLNHQGAFPVRK